MSWAKIDDRANEHRKMLAAGAEACWLWTCGLMYANRQPARDGFIPDAVIGMLYPLKNPKRLAEKLVDVGLWEKVAGGYRIHEFTTWNPTKEQVEESKAKARERAAQSYERRKAQNGNFAPGSAPAEVSQKQDSAGSTSATATSAPTATTGSVAVVTLAERARKVLANPLDGHWQQPSKWPEIMAICSAWSFGMAIKLGDFVNRDSDLRAILEALAAEEFPIDRLLEAGKLAADSEYFKRLERPGPASFTAPVLRRLLSEPRPGTAKGGDYGSAEEYAV